MAAEPRVIQLVETRQIRRAGTTGPLFVASGMTDGINLARDADGSCVFFDRGGGRLCVIHRDAGAEALPVACRHFPRRILRDGRGTFISLSHFCPTAAAMLLTRDALEIVEAQPPLRIEEPFEGLDATDALPPLVRPGLLCDLEGYGAWEHACVATLARPDLTCRDALSVIAAATETTRAWQPGNGTLAAHVEEAFRQAHPGEGEDTDTDSRAMETAASLRDGRLPDFSAIAGPRRRTIGDHPVAPLSAGGQAFTPWLEAFDAPMKHYLAARLFANWIAYQGRGLRSIVEWLRTCAALVRREIDDLGAASRPASSETNFIEAVRFADHLLLHVVDTALVARRFAHLEGSGPR